MDIPIPVLGQAPVLSTPDYHCFTDVTLQNEKHLDISHRKLKDEHYILQKYEIERTVKEVLAGGWKRVALQFPDDMLDDVGAVVSILEKETRQTKTALPKFSTTSEDSLNKKSMSFRDDDANKTIRSNLSNEDIEIESLTKAEGKINITNFKDLGDGGLETDFNMSAIKNQTRLNDDRLLTTVPRPTFKDLGDGGLETDITTLSILDPDIKEEKIKFYILADTSYGSCCVDEIAAQHVDAQVIIHYGRSCLSPTTRLPVIYIFTSSKLDFDAVIQGFEEIFMGEDTNVILMADVTFQSHVKKIQMRLEERGYTRLIAPEMLHAPASRIPNRLIPPAIDLKEYTLFHICEPPPALLLTLNSRVKDMYIYPTDPTSSSGKFIKATTTNLFRRRYGLLNSLNTCSIFGILINTLSVANHLHALDKIQALISAAGKKHYTFVVGKINAAKMANFSEVGGWVVIGCWESSLIDCKEFYRPIITPWELEWVLSSEKVRIWNEEWRGDFEGIGENIEKIIGNADDSLSPAGGNEETFNSSGVGQSNSSTLTNSDPESEAESEPPQFDLRTGRYVSNSRPMQNPIREKSRRISSSPPSSNENCKSSKALTHRNKGVLTTTTIGGVISPGADFLRNHRTWVGLGCDFQEGNDTLGLDVEIGKSGVARGYISNGERS